MLHRNIRSGYRFAVSALSFGVLIALPGCFGAATPQTFPLELPDGTTVTVSLESGVPSLANTSWELSYANTSVPLVTMNFGAAGNLESFTDNHIVEEVLGSTILFDGVAHDTDFPPIQYSAFAVGAPASGGAFVLQAHISAIAPLVGEVAFGTADADGEIDPEDPNVMTGTLSFDFELSSLAADYVTVPADSLNGEFEFTAIRVE